VHDSYLGVKFLKSKDQISGVDTIYDIEYPWWRQKPAPPVNLDKAKKNVLVFEISERSLVDLDSMILMQLVKIKQGGNDDDDVFPRSASAEGEDGVFNKKINTNLEFLLFETRLFTALKELKAKINYKFFNRTSPDVFVSKNKKYLFYYQTKTSIQEKVSEALIEKYVTIFNNTFAYYRSKGFDEIYFSIIPNPVSVIQPDCKRYNKLIPLIQSDSNLLMPMIDIYSIFNDHKSQIYYHSDTHWNKNGFQLWINELNKKICNIK
ncbi:MAG: hypothetical protein ABUL44_02625, partial [Flavobacterium sp.]